ncbi:MAG: toll/interleukin-1 receptor domain-containing protein [Desulfobacterales bacterium]|nr:toll/interleukin-1 receptor domain-containing protein [Desulfobacterales bacterium]
MTQIYLCYAPEDETKVKEIYQKLSGAGFKPWMDVKDILPGEVKENVSKKAIKQSHFFMVFLSANSVTARGTFQKEIKIALKTWDEKLEDDIYLIPVKLDDCIVPEKLHDFQCANISEKKEWKKLIQSIHVGITRQAEQKAEQKNVFLVAPEIPNIESTKMTVEWAEQLKEIMTDLETDLVYFLGKNAVRANVEPALKKNEGKPGIFVFIDHGDKEMLLGADNKALIDSANASLLKNKFVYALASGSATDLGHKTVQAGATGYIGFNNDFHIITTASSMFSHCFLSGLIALVRDNKTAKEAVERIASVTKISAKRMKARKLPENIRIMITASLKHNLKAITRLGDLDWKMRSEK